jgi:hypothetical protein
MREIKTWNIISKHISGEETLEEKDVFFEWLNENESNKVLFNKINSNWEKSCAEEKPQKFLRKFTKKKIKTFIVNQALGNFIGFVVGVSVTHLFSHYTRERKGINNLFGLMKRKQIEVDLIPHWAQWTLSVVAGFIVLELINHIIQTKQYMLPFKYVKKQFNSK